jgi:uroporphyrinogen III methyltransferase/synthase
VRASELSPLEGKRVLVTRAEAQAGEAAELLQAKGAHAVVIPTIAIGPPDDPKPAEDAALRVASYDWVAFTSQNAVERTLELLSRLGREARALASLKVAAVGPATADALRRHGIEPTLVAKDSQGEGLAREMLHVLGGAKRVLLPRAQVAREALPESLRAAGCTVDVVAVYATRPAPGLAASLGPLFGDERPGLDAALFTSGSTLTHVCDALGATAAARLAKVVVAVIGPVTRAEAEKRGIRVDVEASPPTVPALVDALETFFRSRV